MSVVVLWLFVVAVLCCVMMGLVLLLCFVVGVAPLLVFTQDETSVLSHFSPGPFRHAVLALVLHTFLSCCKR